MSYFQGKFSHAPANMPDARQTQNFINQLQDREKQRKERAKALSEDQKRLSLLAQGYGLEKGEADAMSRGEIQGFVEQQAMLTAQKKATTDNILNLAKFQNQMQQTDVNRQIAQSQMKMAEANMLSAQNKAKQFNAEKFLTGQDAGIVREEIARHQGNLNSEDPMLRREANQYFDRTGLRGGLNNLSDERLLEQHRAGMAKNQPNPYDAMSPVQTHFDKANIDALTGFNPIVAQSNKRKIATAVSKLKSAIASGKPITGTAVSFLPDFLRNIVDEEGMELQQNVEKVIQMNLRETLGAQFAQKEGEMFMSRGFNPQGNDPDNLRRLEDLLLDIQRGIDEQINRYDHYMTPRGPYGINTFHGFVPPTLQGDGNQTKEYQQTTSSGNGVNINIPGSVLKKK